jgi:endonuclease YncB( thermonuclease family)
MFRAVALILALWMGFLAAPPPPPPSAADTERRAPSEVAEATREALVDAPLPDTKERAAKNLAGPYRVVKVVDGDTLVVDIDGSATTLRLIGLDTPETLDPRKPVQCFGREASDRAKALLTDQYVRLEYDKTQGVLDKYDRTLAYIYLPDGTLFNEYMIAEGFAHEYTYNLPYQYQKRFQDAEDAARTGLRGLWADAACAAESDRAAPSFRAMPVLMPDTAEFVCSRNAYNCADFSTQARAQAAYDACGGVQNDVHLLDRDLDGSACETLP